LRTIRADKNIYAEATAGKGAAAVDEALCDAADCNDGIAFKDVIAYNSRMLTH